MFANIKAYQITLTIILFGNFINLSFCQNHKTNPMKTPRPFDSICCWTGPGLTNAVRPKPVILTPDAKNFEIINGNQHLPYSFTKQSFDLAEDFYPYCIDIPSEVMPCKTAIIDLNNDNKPEIIVDAGFLGLRLFTNHNGQWEYKCFLSANYIEKASTAFNNGLVSVSEPRWQDLTIDGKTYQIYYASESVRVAKNASLLAQFFGVFPVSAFPPKQGKFIPHSLIATNRKTQIPNEIYEQYFPYYGGSGPPCLDSSIETTRCIARNIDINQDGIDEIIFQERDKSVSFSILYKSQNRWEILSLTKPKDFGKAIDLSNAVIRIQKPRWNDVKIGDYSYRVALKENQIDTSQPSCTY